MSEALKSFEIYIHIPFCAQKCLYCDFLSFHSDEPHMERYVDQLCAELELAADRLDPPLTASTVFIGGGTPSLLDPKYISRIMYTLRRHFHLAKDAEVTIECNPASTLRTKFRAYLDAGINRLSIGLQSANDDELRTLGRIHIYDDFLNCFQGARMEGFRNINVDLMNDFPTQTAASWKKTLRNVLMLRPEHVSIYNLIVEDGTPFKKMQEMGRLLLPDEETQAEIDEITKDETSRHGYARYEVSNYARPGYECRHNLGYWSNVPYLGFGLGASSFFGGKRWNNTRSIEKYLSLNMASEARTDFASLRENVKALDRNDEMEEFMFLGLRKMEGVSELDFKKRFSVDIQSVFGPVLEKYLKMGMLRHVGCHYAFSERGMEVSNQILCDFLLT